MGDECHCEHGNSPLTRDEALNLAFNILVQAAGECNEGRPTEASVLNSVAQTAIALAERMLPLGKPELVH